MKVFGGRDEMLAAAGSDLGTSEWVNVEQDRIDTFADATGDHQWIHVDADKAAAGPFGTTIAHGFLSLSLLPVLMSETYRVEGQKMGVNYGLNRVRFPAPVPVGSRVRAAVTVDEVTEAGDALQVVWGVTIEIEGAAKPACVAQWVTRMYF